MKIRLVALAVLGLGASAVHAQEVVKLGVAAPLTGTQAHLGKDIENGVRLAIEEYNAKGVTLGGKKIKFDVQAEDDQADPKTATTVAQRLADSGVKGVVGHLNSGASIPASRIYNEAGLPQVSPASTNPKLTQQNFKATFRTIANDVQQGLAIGKYAATKLGKKVALIDDRTAYGQGLADEVEKAVKANGGSLTGREFTSDKATDFLAILTRIKAQNPDVIVYSGMDTQAGPMLKQIKQLGINAKFITGDGGCTGEVIKLAGDAISGNAYCTQPGLPLEKMPGGKNFNERFKKRFNADVQIYAPYSYDAASAIIEAMKAANSADPAKYAGSIGKVNFPGVIGTVAFDAKGDIKDGAVTVYQFKAGKWEALQ
ncbi:branched-chain amino acid ABC transporter substrate-binding protein [Zoogloea sp.]|uniref:branched-chain amino acid ABC transporter substrate-binding protein n=1 Tax=Zoogloea sp. TaxID=49181 RepID=UPI0025E0DB6A|nr:branched-chain amino acid ABC transporter substrate-binding protein [Zoogloea sp.]MCK6393893.1 branched-chain amino acid ABC transporter substrate-binding protein [Zoogloea sp.]